MKSNYPTGADASPFDVRTFTFSGDKASQAPYEIGESWANTEFIEDQHRVGICTAISLAMRARKHYGIAFNADFQYLLQKKYIDGNWNEGSSAFSAIKVGHKHGFLPASEWTHTSIDDRKLSYAKYIKKLKAIPDEEIERLLKIAAQYKIAAYAKLPNTIDAMASAIAENGAVISRFLIGNEWWRGQIEPLQNPIKPISGHLVNTTKRHGDSYRIANSWDTDWADGGTAYGLFSIYQPTEMWQVWFADIPDEIQKQIESREQLIGKLKDLLQELISKFNKLKLSK